MKKCTLFITLLISGYSFAKSTFLDSVERLKWKDLEVVWIEDDKFPKFTASIYFQDGALSDSLSGVTQATFDQLTSGTKVQTEKQIADYFDFYGANLLHSVTHEYSVLTIQALTKDIGPVIGKVCELMQEAQYPEQELKSYVSRSKSRLKNLVTSHAALADRVFRQISLKGTEFERPVEGTLASYGKLNSDMLKKRLEELSMAKKVLYLAGPTDAKEIRNVIEEKCKWKSESKSKSVSLTKSPDQSAIYLLPVPGANQAQIRMGRYLNFEEMTGKYDQYHFLAGFLGGGFTSKLVQELRVKRGLTYSASAYVSMQRDYARAGVMTFSKSETTAETISIVRDVFADMNDASKISSEEFNHQKGHQIGAHAFEFEETNAFLGQIMLYDHQGRNLDELVNFPERIKNLKASELSGAHFQAFPWSRMTVVVVGDKSLVKSLSRIRPVKVLDYKDFL